MAPRIDNPVAHRLQGQHRGPLATCPGEAGAFIRTRPESTLPDNQFYFTPWGVPPPNADEDRGLQAGRHVTIWPTLLYPRSVGELRLRGADPAAAPIIDPRYLSAPEDLEHLVVGAKLAREIAATAPLAGMRSASTACAGSGSPTPRSCRASSAATRTRRRS